VKLTVQNDSSARIFVTLAIAHLGHSSPEWPSIRWVKANTPSNKVMNNVDPPEDPASADGLPAEVHFVDSRRLSWIKRHDRTFERQTIV
jgi:hypothetical protein